MARVVVVHFTCEGLCGAGITPLSHGTRAYDDDDNDGDDDSWFSGGVPDDPAINCAGAGNSRWVWPDLFQWIRESSDGMCCPLCSYLMPLSIAQEPDREPSPTL